MSDGDTPEAQPQSALAHVVVTPARDEERTLPRTIASMASQTRPPLQWVVVDDGSTDRTPEILHEAAADLPWLTVLHHPDRGTRRMGYTVAFEGLGALASDSWAFLTKLDADVAFEPDYFERLLGRFDADPSLGIAGGGLHEEREGEWRFVPHPRFHVRGGVKTYRRECWDQVGHLTAGLANDTLDEVKANQLGWRTHTFVDLAVQHLRPTGQAVGSWSNAVKNGRHAWHIGYHPLFQLSRAVKVLADTRSPAAGAGLAWGYLRAAVQRDERPDDPELRRYVRRQQLRRLTGRPSIWR